MEPTLAPRHAHQGRLLLFEYSEEALQRGHCGLDMPATAYFDLSPKLAGFGIERFDRVRGMRVPTISVAALLDDNFRLPTRDYEVLLRATRALTRDERQVKKAFERCVFNVVFNNRDDHTKNFGYVMNESMQWELAPCYDLTYNVGVGGRAPDDDRR